MQPLNSLEEELVRAWFRLAITLPRSLDADLQAGQGVSLREYGALMHLSEAPERRLRIGDLAALCDMSLSGMTRMIDNLVRAGLIARVQSDNDGRGADAVLTEKGLERLRDAYPVHLAGVRSRLVEPLHGMDLPQLVEAMQACVTASAPAKNRRAP
ncbi:MarR family transcriptional regulator [Actinoplanes sp. Pm04-4]|uniref:MarR family transcriptional regulator n=1 Tax=Paractinoplanes pyxinae TaxID=2997416 RepID=A0ABT4B4L2_9ACTN|nr:MarR family transcriptional regulator [Actinoplanes pyxinae]MCY1141442.1 MarR family transcriptional regulator [Actinoplanes pyxinae]